MNTSGVSAARRQQKILKIGEKYEDSDAKIPMLYSYTHEVAYAV
jgi:hypothetical protein